MYPESLHPDKPSRSMNRVLPADSPAVALHARQWLVATAIVAILLAGISVVYLPPFWATACVGLAGMVFVLARPRAGLVLLFVGLYFPLLPNVSFGPLELSMTSFITAGLFAGTLTLQRRDSTLRLARWQAALLAALGISFILAALFSDSVRDSLIGLPNLVVYWMLLYACMVLVRSVDQLWLFARWILVLAFLVSVWRLELAPLRLWLGLADLGINGAVFTFHAAMAIAMVVAMMLPGSVVSPFWRGFAWLALFSFVYHGLLYQTRSGWLAWAVLVLMMGIQVRGRARGAFAFAAACIALMALLLFPDVINRNIAQTEATIHAAVGSTSYAGASSDDVIRLVAHNAGLRMFQARPMLGWGPNAYYRLKPAFVDYLGKEASVAGAFDSWLIALVEWGVVGTVIALLVFLVPLPIAWRAVWRTRNTGTVLAFGLALGVLAISIHLVFIDLLYSFAWAHAGLALAGVRLAMEQS